MSITSVQQIEDAMAHGQHRAFQKSLSPPKAVGGFGSGWLGTGLPGTGAAPPVYTAGSGYTCSKSTAGALAYVNAAAQNYLAGLSLTNTRSSSGILIIADRLWSCGGMGFAAGTYTVTTPGSLPARITDNGIGCELFVEQFVVAGAASGTLTANYLDSSNAAQSGVIGAVSSAPPAGSMQMVPLANNLGIKQLTSVVTSATWTSGTFGMTIIKRLIEVPFQTSTDGKGINLDWAQVLTKIPNDACLMFIWLGNGTAVVIVQGSIDIIDQ